ncbi:pimeloyl-ACP methyl ester carboxylesterase [Chitinophaga skermanii]|uniref:Pimeloyl-ACP methyl ester carboxylesterase n=1 Tax=Chitinophaga skermanii TaxID=331697 RepID=A0A327QFG6_9BACT|nr:alpha/beta hydrolase [Chitinophaga skermanii]RAJ00427.1 pimeloyl-ACP methyl ester carboxylesterase [Chitinophaga skermanii]
MKQINSKTVLFVTGNFVSNLSWNAWKDYFEQAGYKTFAPAWPHKEGSAAELRKRQPDAGIASNRLTQIVDFYEGVIKTLPEKPIIVGHSMGGLITQLLVQRGLAEAAVAIHSVPPQGVLTGKFSFYKATWGPLGFFTNPNKSFLMSFPQWQYAFTNGMPLEEQKAAYEAYAIPESKRLSRDGLTGAAKIDFKKPHAPLLFMAGEIDHIMPASLNYTNFKKYSDKQSVTEYKVNKGRNHYVLGQPTWKEDAAYILNWIQQH